MMKALFGSTHNSKVIFTAKSSQHKEDGKRRIQERPVWVEEIYIKAQLPFFSQNADYGYISLQGSLRIIL